jgi:hypothetical protein
MPRHGSRSDVKTRQHVANVELNEMLVIRSLASFIASGRAGCEIIGSGEVELRLETGETFLLRATTITRVA